MRFIPIPKYRRQKNRTFPSIFWDLLICTKLHNIITYYVFSTSFRTVANFQNHICTIILLQQMWQSWMLDDVMVLSEDVWSEIARMGLQNYVTDPKITNKTVNFSPNKIDDSAKSTRLYSTPTFSLIQEQPQYYPTLSEYTNWAKIQSRI